MLRLCSLLFIVISAAMPVGAQLAATVSGVVLDATGAVVAEAGVSLRLSRSETSLYTARTTSSGVYTLSSVNPGTYDLWISAKGRLPFPARFAVAGELYVFESAE